MTSGWYFAKAGATAGNETGPFAWEELYRLAQTGAIEPGDLVWNPKLPRGVAAGLVPGLFPEQPTSPTPVWQKPEETAPAPLTEEPPTPPTPPAPPVEDQALITDGPDALPAIDGLEEETTVEGRSQEPPTRRSRRSERPKSDKRTDRLPLLVVLLAFVIAAAGVAAYFLYFRV